ncbi:MAG: SpoIVB peptidase [Oscillospiraceae bacterium]
MKQIRKLAAWALAAMMCLSLSANAFALEAEALVPMGSTVGIQLRTEGILIVGLGQVETESGVCSPASDAGLQPGDRIVKLGKTEIKTAADFLSAVAELDGSAVTLTALRDGKEMTFQVTPARAAGGGWQLGLWLRDGVSGIGTLTFYDPVSGVYGALGHGINDTDTGLLLPAAEGVITHASVVDVIRGCEGKPGELCGTFDKEEILGSISSNTGCGIFGVYEDGGGCGQAIPVAEESEVRLGAATILANVSGDEVEEYSVEISRIYRDSGDNRFLMLTVTDPRLLETTGGIVQGMSGSPILQDGKLIGAVTHVLISDPTRGYGISIQDMLDAA